MNTKSVALATLIGLISTPALATPTIRVGGDRACDTSSIQTAIDWAHGQGSTVDVLIARNATYSNQYLEIENTNVRLIGGFADCAQSEHDLVPTVISGAGGKRGSVINVFGETNEVEFHRLDIQDGDEVEDVYSYGGGVDIRQGPHAKVYFESVRLLNNRAGVGGGLSIRNNSTNRSAVFVWFGPNNLIANNQGIYQAGGVHCQDATLHIKGPNNSIFANQAGLTGNEPGRPERIEASGGGLYLHDCKTRIGTHSLIGSIANNHATRSGGGVLVAGAKSELGLYNIDANQPNTIMGNTAEHHGGGIAIDDDADVFIADGVVDGNRAHQAGGAFYIYDEGDEDTAHLRMSRFDASDASSPFSSPYDIHIQCAKDMIENCNRVQGNIAMDAKGVRMHGSVAALSAGEALDALGFMDRGRASLYFRGSRMDQNLGRSLIKHSSHGGGIQGSSTNTLITGAVIHDNVAEDNLLQHDYDNGIVIHSNWLGGRFQINSSTIANNLFDQQLFGGSGLAGYTPRLELELHSSIVWQNQPINTGESFAASESLVRNPLGIHIGWLGSNILGLDPQFIAPWNGDYRLGTNSPALDLVQHEDANFIAIGGPVTRYGQDNVTGRRVDLLGVVNGFNKDGIQDAGAYEMPSNQ